MACYPMQEERQALVKVSYDAALKERLSRAGDMEPRAVEIVEKFDP